MTAISSFPFQFGAQYYRAPTPAPEHWAADLRAMREIGFTDVKFWVQWRWSERSAGAYLWDDLDQLMDLAQDNDLRVTLNLILDVAPGWLDRECPDSRMVDATGRSFEPRANLCRQLGGYPGPCYSHPQARELRERFVTEAVRHFSRHPALFAWDVWNEPENNLHHRDPGAQALFCYCPECRSQFLGYLQERYPSLGALNAKWGRCYCEWREVEVPLQPETIADFQDWREFHLEKLTREGRWRLRVVQQNDPARLRYLHVVANTADCFNVVTGVDDVDLAAECQVFASSMNTSPLLCAQAVSAAPDKPFFNAECHINFGGVGMHQRVIDQELFLREMIPQIGWGVKGVLFWQFRPESLGTESPAWGIISPDGSSRPVTEAVREFGARFLPYAKRLLAAKPVQPRIGVWRSRRNELFHYAMDGQLQDYSTALRGYAQVLYRLNLPFRFVWSQQMRAGALADLRVLVLPDPYCLSQEEADCIDDWVQRGGVLLSEAHLGGYNDTTGRHSQQIPGCGLAEAWGLRETESTSSFHLPVLEEEADGEDTGARGDVAIALRAHGVRGGERFRFVAADGSPAWGARRFAVLDGGGVQREGSFGAEACAVSKPVGRGYLYYVGTLLGRAAAEDDSFLRRMLLLAAARAGIDRTCANDHLHVDLLQGERDEPMLVVVGNEDGQEQTAALRVAGRWRGLFSACEICAGLLRCPPHTWDILVPA